MHLKTNQQGSPFWLCFPRISFFLNGSPGHAELCRLENSCGVQGWDLPTCAEHNIWIILHDSLGTRGSPPMLLSNSQIQPYSLPLRKKRRGGRKERSRFKFFCRLSNIALNYILTGRCQDQLRQRGGAIVGHHSGGHIFGKLNFLHLHLERRGNLAFFSTFYWISIYLKPMSPKMFEFQCETLTCPEYQGRESKAQTGPPLGRTNDPILF